jgi:CspA family cold shock protein
VAQGSVKWFSAERGYGFAGVDQGPDVFVHYSAIAGEHRELIEGQRIEFDVIDGTHGPMAEAVRPL